MSLVTFNKGGTVLITPQAGTLTVTINGTEFTTTTGGANQAAIVGDFIAEHLREISQRYQIMLTLTGTGTSGKLKLWNVQGAAISSDGTAQSNDLSDELGKNIATLETTSFTNQTTVVFNFSGDAASDVVTCKVPDYSAAQDLVYQVESASRPGMRVTLAVAHGATPS